MIERKKIAIVVQRYGLEVNGGAEFHARILAEKLALKHHINVLTTRAIDSNSWANHYAIDDNIVNEIKVQRFNSNTQNGKKFRKARRIILEQTLFQRFLKKLKIFNFVKKYTNFFLDNEKISNRFLKEQGPYCPDLIKYIKTNKDNYDCFVFFTYLFYPTVTALPFVSEKSIFIPTAHDEPLLYTLPYQNLFSLPKYILYNTLSEKNLIETNFSNFTRSNDVVGIGIDEITVTQKTKADNSYNYDFEYLIYIGRIEGAKGCEELINYFNQANFDKKIKLVLVGKNYTSLKESDNVIFTGFVSEQHKYKLLSNSLALIIPSKYESLSLVTLEAMLHKKPVIANYHCEVLRDHINQSSAGFTYTSSDSFQSQINKLLTLSIEEKKKISESGYNYVIKNYSWNVIIEKFEKALDFVTMKY